ncbi:uncharacterized protein BKA78DRAFT_298760 [Phyllosticta capitalensis]|uniref:Uncharacterized protein n=1 Tax=Phyllosticta capitalensis TaxID=121624 RepID=A0ABR1YIL3_9PEZI
MDDTESDYAEESYTKEELSMFPSTFALFFEDILDTILERRFAKAHIKDHGQFCYCPRYDRSEDAYLTRKLGMDPHYNNLCDLLNLGPSPRGNKQPGRDPPELHKIILAIKFFEVTTGPLRKLLKVRIPFALAKLGMGTVERKYWRRVSLSERSIIDRWLTQQNHLVGLHKTLDEFFGFPAELEKAGSCCFPQGKERARSFVSVPSEYGCDKAIRIESISTCLLRCSWMTLLYLAGRDWSWRGLEFPISSIRSSEYMWHRSHIDFERRRALMRHLERSYSEKV